MIARLLRVAWVGALAVAAVVAWWAIGRFGPVVGPWAAGIGAVVAVVALHPLTIGCHFVASRIGGDPVPAAERPSFLGALAMWDAEIDASMRGVWFATPFREHVPAPVPREPRRRLALLFLHGAFCNRAVWHSFMRDAASRGYACVSLTLAELRAPIEAHAGAVADAIDALCPGGDERVAIVAHSMGGLVARAAAQRIDVSRLAHVVTLGTPHAGTRTARLSALASVVQMRRGSPWLARLAEREADGAGLPRDRYTTVWSRHDDIVYPQSTGALDGATEVAIARVGHVALLYDRRVRTIVFERLAAVEAALDAADDQVAIGAAAVAVPT